MPTPPTPAPEPEAEEEVVPEAEEEEVVPPPAPIVVSVEKTTVEKLAAFFEKKGDTYLYHVLEEYVLDNPALTQYIGELKNPASIAGRLEAISNNYMAFLRADPDKQPYLVNGLELVMKTSRQYNESVEGPSLDRDMAKFFLLYQDVSDVVKPEFEAMVKDITEKVVATDGDETYMNQLNAAVNMVFGFSLALNVASNPDPEYQKLGEYMVNTFMQAYTPALEKKVDLPI